MAHRLQRAEARWHALDECSVYGLARNIRGIQAIFVPSEIPQPAPGLRQRYAHVPAAAFAGLAGLGHHRAERHQIAGGVVEHLRRQFLWPIYASSLSLGMVEAGRGLHERIEAAPFRPWTGMAIGRQRHVDDAGIDFCRVLGRKAESGERARAIAL